MFYARDEHGQLVDPSPKARAACPICIGLVQAKCGEWIEWHWAHVGDRDCDTWSETETPWHRWWKERAPAEQREVTMGDKVKHRADIVRDDGYVIELQHSPISGAEIRAREAFYRRMVWLVDARLSSRDCFFLTDFVPRFYLVKPGLWHWRWPKKSYTAARRKVFLDLGTYVVEVDRFEQLRKEEAWRTGLGSGFYVHGKESTRDQFLDRARLRPVEDRERSRTISYVAEWRVERRKGDDERRREALERRELRNEAALKHWLDRRKRKDLFVFRWLGDGSTRNDLKWGG